jgi:hypothetical protein
MSDWATIASLATAGGTLVLALATFSSVRASQRSTRIAEEALLIGRRPMLAPARDTDASMTVFFGDRTMVTVSRGLAAVELDDGRFYFVLPLRNVGAGIAVLHAWRLMPTPGTSADAVPEIDRFRRQQRDLYIPAGDVGFWQAALRDADDEMREGIDTAHAKGDRITVDLLYGDHEGGQRAVTRFVLTPSDGIWIPGVVRHWRLDGVNPRD